ncbi:MAG: hypothetical protein EGQ10_03705 [Clostridiales bacterium]|nr:hypothetical protein [Clostridiales bacterium]
MTFFAMKNGIFSEIMTEMVYNSGRKGKRKVFGKTNCYKNVIFLKKGLQFVNTSDIIWLLT